MPQNTKTVFVANIPYDVSEEQIANVFSEVGPVSNVEIKFDPQTGKSKGYAFVQFYDEAAAQSAMRNLQDIPINGRPVRIELSNDERAGPGRRGPGPAFGRHGGREPSPPRGGFGRGDDIDMSLLPPGQDPPPGRKATDAISKTLAEVNPGQMQEVMAGMKSLVNTQPEQARQLLTQRPQLAYALFQAMLLMNIVDPSVLQRIQPLPPNAPPPSSNMPSYQQQQQLPQQALPPAAYPPYPPAGGAAPPFRAPQPPAPYGTPPPPVAAPPQPSYGGYPPAPPAPSASPAGLPPSTQAALAGLPEDQKAMLVQVLQLTPDQINALDPAQQASVKQLRQQFLGAA